MFNAPSIKYCNHCGHSVKWTVPEGDTRIRAVCPSCQTIQYQNPLNVAGTIPVWHDGRVLLCKRNIEPRYGFWTLPAGFLELGETIAEGAARETVEEAGAQFDMGRLFTIMNVVSVGQVHFYYLAQLADKQFNPGPESIEARLFAEKDIPWEALAFTTVRTALEFYFQDRHSPQTDHCIYTADIDF